MGSEENANALVSLLGSPAIRNASLSLFAAVGIALCVRSLVNAPPPRPRVADREDVLQRFKEKKHEKVVDKRDVEPVVPIKRNNDEESEERHTSPHRRHERSLSASTAGGGGNTSKISIAIFWDVDNCQPNSGASGHEVAQAIRRATQSIGPDAARLGSIVSFKAYLELSNENSTPNAAQVQLRSELQGSGVSLIDTPKSGRKDVADKMMIADLLAYAIDKRPPALIVLLSGDRDFAYPLGILRNRGYEILLITPPVGATPILEASANYKLRWRQDVLGLEFDAHGRPYDRSKTAAAVTRAPPTASTLTSHGPVGPIPGVLKAKQVQSTPPVFEPLVSVLTQMRNEGHPRPLRSFIASRLVSGDPLVYEQAQASGWGEYVAIAEAAGIVTLGQGTHLGREWISLRDSSETRAEVPLPPVSILKNPAATTAAAATANAESPSNAASAPIGNDVSAFFPLIEAHNALRRSLPAGQEPMTRDLSTIVSDIGKTVNEDTNQHLHLPAYEVYLRQAYRARIARLAPPENGEAGTVVQLSSRYAAMSTGFALPSSTVALIKEKAGASQAAAAIERRPSPPSQTQNGKQAEAADEPNAVQTSKAGSSEWTTVVSASKSKTSPALENKKAIATETKSTSSLCFPHQPSGEIIHTTYFPMANFLLTQRSAGQLATPEPQVYMSVTKHHKLGKIIQSMKEFHDYLAKAVADDVVNVIKVEGVSFVCLHERLAKGEGDGKHRGFRAGHNATRSDDHSAVHSSPTLSSKKAHTSKISEAKAENTHTTAIVVSESPQPSVTKFDRPQPSARFGTVSATSQDRHKLKPLIEAMVLHRKRMSEKADKIVNSEEDRLSMHRFGIEPLRSTVISTILQSSSGGSAAGNDNLSISKPAMPALPPGPWLQEHGYTNFGELFDEAERKGFVHLVVHADGRDRVRLSQKYEDMFFSKSTSSTTSTTTSREDST